MFSQPQARQSDFSKIRDRRLQLLWGCPCTPHQWRSGFSDIFFGCSTRTKCKSSRQCSMFDCIGHSNWKLRSGNSCIEKYSVAAKLKCKCDVGCGAQPSVYDNRNICPRDDQRQVVWISDAESRANWCCEGHHRLTADVFKSSGEDWIVIGIRKHIKSALTSASAALRSSVGSGSSVSSSAMTSSFIQFVSRASCKFCSQYGLFGREATSCIGKNVDAF